MPESDFNAKIIEEFRANGGVVGGPFEGATLLLLHHTGAKSGKRYTSPLVYRRDGDRYLIFASKGGPRRTPTGTTISRPIRTSRSRSAPKRAPPPPSS